MRKTTLTRLKRVRTLPEGSQPSCGLCRKTAPLTRTACCGQWICDDAHAYVLFSFARNSCSHNHARFTLCGYHHAEGHPGTWQTCQMCRASFETEMYVWYGTNVYNFERLPHPPAYQPTRCGACDTVIRLGEDSYRRAPNGKYYCVMCTDLPGRLSSPASRRRKR